MTTYKEIKGQLIRQVSSDPSDPQIGQIWYNNTTGALKAFLTIDAAWSAGGNLNTARRDLAGCGTKSLALGFGGLETGTTASAGNGYFCNTTGGAFTLTLPSSPTIGDEVSFVDYAGTFDTNNLTIGRNSEKINGATADLTVATERAANTLVYTDGTQGWLLKNN